ncbi:1-aminocyclopropane-1-carboxylate oxidase [Fusarium pseudoanthophilum]|uniref:1-aminocyclopropane-1-carboxylate oxidase n=1 Tax=Fusarium pseudoanthophilum TaxID=48495 RepID=A0A8H5KNW1_9HYPO|nr:1-aminocyclopropane-1-carboxylate oxidase [Fusarium pseudoanthophilum]
MATTTIETTAPVSAFTTVQLMTPDGPVSRRVRCGAPRTPTLDEMPVIDLSSLDGDATARKAIATKIKAAAENTGFFYVNNHGIPQELIEQALEQCKAFFNQEQEAKDRVSFEKAGKFCGYHGVGSTQINNQETRDKKETFSMRYDTRIDQTHDCSDDINSNFSSTDYVWDGTSHLTKFRPVLTEFYQKRLTLARKLIRLFALALDLPEDYFDSIITTPGADAVHIHYPGTDGNAEDVDVGIGSHTDIQCVTLLWQDMSGGLQVLSADDEWLDARPIEGTLVINIGDFLQRLSNNRFKSTVHRVYNRQKTSRYAMPFFLGFNPDAVCEVLPTCIDEEHPPLYEPISCGKWRDSRLRLAETPDKEKAV